MRLPRVGLCWAAVAGLILVILGHSGSWISATLCERGSGSQGRPEQGENTPEGLSGKHLPELLKDLPLTVPSPRHAFTVARNGSRFSVETSLDSSLQGFIHDLLSRSQTVRAAMVVLNPGTGQILAIADSENGNGAGGGGLPLKAEYPAASLFKIVAAAAAIEARGFTPESTMSFRGRKYTLYRSQLKPEKGDSGVRMSLREAFSASINPIFGKIGIYALGKDLMEDYAQRFLFNQSIPFELPLEVSPVDVPADDFGLAEIASGFNKRTMISPVHAALLSAAVANKGVIMKPWLIRAVKDDHGRVVYRAEPSRLARPITEDTARKMRVLMHETVITGTCRKAFRPLHRKESFSDIELGAKTGTINDSLDQYRVDWVTAYAIPEGEDGSICISGLALHGEKVGIRVKDMVRAVIDNYFSSETAGKVGNGSDSRTQPADPDA
ncbi:MAG: hypothetical protein JXL84_16125 [Deltaproteobacteria bacterium]|nr:hypothetical protein [Deltaproteobacteria bacterium]